MNQASEKYLERLEKNYRKFNDNDSLLALAEVREQDERIRELKVYREQPKTQELIAGAVARFRECIERLTDPEVNKKMTDIERTYCFATMDWARFTLDMVGENPALLEQEVEKTILTYARRAGLST
jgi:hypothetical protein